MKYSLAKPEGKGPKPKLSVAVKRLLPLLADEKRTVIIGFAAIVATSFLALVTPLIIGHVVDTYIRNGDFGGVMKFAALLLGIFIVWMGTSYVQTQTMGGVGRRLLFNLRNSLFNKLESLPLAFFNANKSGDLISRINNDTDQLNMFFAQALIQLLGNLFLVVGAAIFLLALNLKLGLVTLVPAVLVFIVSRMISGWVKSRNLKNLQALGGLSAQIQESIANFKVIVAFNRFDYFKNSFATANETNYQAAVKAGVANNIFQPLYGLAMNLGQMAVLFYAVYLVGHGEITVGLIVSFLLYVNNFYMPLRQMAAFWSSLQQALAGLDRINQVLSMESDIVMVPDTGATASGENILEMKNVHFRYEDGKEVLGGVSLSLEKGKTYALVGPTGGGKTTTASLMARLYDPTEGTILLSGKDIRSYEPSVRAEKIGFILQEPLLFSGTVRDNIVYGNEKYFKFTNDELRAELETLGLSKLLARFDGGLDTKVTSSGDGISLGQKQLIAFMRATLRHPELLILDEATANIDTVTEQQLEEILEKLPKSTTKVIIAHRLNTIRSADAIFFVGGKKITLAGSMEHAVDMLLKTHRES